jgi:hypothetical protein
MLLLVVPIVAVIIVLVVLGIYTGVAAGVDSRKRKVSSLKDATSVFSDVGYGTSTYRLDDANKNSWTLRSDDGVYENISVSVSQELTWRW